MGESASTSTVRHKTLSTYYPTLTTLGTHLAAYDAVYHSDPEEYRALLETTLCAPRDDAGPAPPPGPAEWTQQEAIDRILDALVKERGSRGDALVLGTKVVPSLL